MKYYTFQNIVCQLGIGYFYHLPCFRIYTSVFRRYITHTLRINIYYIFREIQIGMLSKLRIAFASLQMRRFSTNAPPPYKASKTSKASSKTSFYLLSYAYLIAVIGTPIFYVKLYQYHRDRRGKLN